MTFNARGIQLGPVIIGYFGLILILAMAAGGFISYRRARRRGENPDIVLDALTWGLVIGIAVARLAYVLNPPPSVAAVTSRRWFLTHPFDLQMGPLAIWSGGLGMGGALVGGILGVYLLLRRREVDVWLWADILTPGALAGIVIGTLANLVNQQMYGPPTRMPWGIPIERPAPPYDLLPDGARFHPTPFYLGLWTLATFVILHWLRGRVSLRRGELFLLGLLIYTPGLFLADFVRVDLARWLFGLSGMQVISVVLFGAALVMLIRRRLTGEAEAPTDAASRLPPPEVNLESGETN